MKRGAERQLTKDDGGDDEIEEIQEPQGFQKADESTLAKRQIRALPKRASIASRPPSLNGLPPVSSLDVEKVEAVPQPKFGGFAGFGTRTSASSPFTFTPQPPVVSASSPSAFDSAFKPLQSTPTTVSPFLVAPKPASLDSDASSPKPTTTQLAEETDAVALKYFKSIRGLNVSFLSTISAAVEKDPFFNVANLVESYKNLRTTIQSEFDGSSQPSTFRGPPATNSGPVFGSKTPPEKPTTFSMPRPPVVFAEPSPKLPSIGGSDAKTSGFTFPPFVPPSSVPTQLPFGLTPKPDEPSTPSSATYPEPPKSTFTLAPSSTPTSMASQLPSSSFTFGVPSTIETATAKLVPSPSSQETKASAGSSRPSSTTPSFGSTIVSNPFATTKPMSAFGPSEMTSKPTSAFSGPVFGNSSTTESSEPPSDSKDSSKVTTTLFGNATATSSSSTNIFRSPDKPVSFFGSASQPKTSAFAFGKPGGSIGNPVGFGFGGSSPGTGDAATPGSSNSGFSFGTSSTKPNESLFSPPITDKSSESTPQPEAGGNEEGGEEDAVKLLPSHTHDEEGEGEEDEETTHVARCKVFRLLKSGDKSEWRDLGIGMLRLKKHKETNVRRVLMRNSNTGRIVINFRVYATLKPTSTKTSVSFVGYEDSTPTSYTIRTKTEEQARDLKQAIEREVAAVQPVE